MLQVDITMLLPALMTKLADAIAEMERDDTLKGYGVDAVRISEARRELAVQMAYYSRGRMLPQDVMAMYKAAGLYAIAEAETKIAVTWTLDSKHLRGLAVDLVPVRGGKLWWAAPLEVWERMGVIGEGHGLKWGGRWKNKDSPHFEL
jgi:hypothetical protein